MSGTDESPLTYFDYVIKITPDGARFKACVTRQGGLIEHEGTASESWVSASCVSAERALLVAKTAIDTDTIR